MYLLNLVILLLILINLAVCSYGLYKKVNETYYMDGEGDSPDYATKMLDAFNKEGYEDELLNADELKSKFNSEGYEEDGDTIKANLSNLYGE